jgi:hypothetical protein
MSGSFSTLALFVTRNDGFATKLSTTSNQHQELMDLEPLK